MRSRSTRRLVLAALAAALLGAPGAVAQVSPGPLSTPHAALDTPLSCFQCHGRGDEGLDRGCLECHQEIGALQQAGRGIHARIGDQSCARCHPEHGGRDFELISWREGAAEKFDHAGAGWPLEGKHTAQKCDACHKAAFRVSPLLAKSPRKTTEPRWIGLEPGCAACHEDAHKGSVGTDCQRCHGAEAFKPAVKFDHARSKFPLVGKHEKVDCEKCHKPDPVQLVAAGAPRRIVRYAPLRHDDCADCHQDPHRGQLKGACSSCHVTDDFHKVDTEKFDHERTRYPLRGKHRAVTCAKCHDPARGGARPAYDRCAACHRDAHAGQATLAGAPAGCEACHSVDGFRPSTFTLASHAKTKYPLDGKHREVQCGKCHAPFARGTAPPSLGPAGVQMRPAAERCTSCHRDAHGAQLASRDDKGECASCHTVNGFKPSTFDLAKHKTTRFPLEGRHAEAACALCHGPERKGLPPLPGPDVLGAAKIALAIRSDCGTCHRDPHEGRFLAKGARPKADGCAACHGTMAFRPSTFGVRQHAAAFALDGAHRAVPCFLCHTDLKAPPDESSLLLAKGPAMPLTAKHEACADCHQSPHGSQFDTQPHRGRCEACHTVEAFRPAGRFDHRKVATFALDGAHQRVACSKCHPTRAGADGRPLVVYRPVPAACKDCHRKDARDNLKTASGTKGATS